MPSSSLGKQLLIVGLALLAWASMWYYVRRIVIPHQGKHAAQLDHPRGNLSDLYPRWLGSRELLLRGRDPYSLEVTLEIQRGYYGREIDPSRPHDPKDQQRFAYPVYVAFLLAPTAHMDFSEVRLLFIWLLTGLTVVSVLLWERAMGAEFSRWGSLAAVLLVLGSYPFVEAVELQQLTLLVAALLAGSFLARQSGWLFLSGFLLAVATIKPQLALLPVALMLLWVSKDWRSRRNWLAGFAVTMLVLFGASESLLRGWLVRFYDAVRSYQSYMAGTSFLDLLVTPRWSGIAWTLVVLPVLWVCWKSRALLPDAAESRRAICLVLAAAVCTAPNLGLYNQILLLPGVLFLLEHSNAVQNRGILVRSLSRIAVVLLAWPWITSGVLIVARIVFHAEAFVQWAWQLPIYTALSLPVVLMVLLFVSPFSPVPSERAFPSPETLA
jgi:Glycosyltransferase family 87